LFEQTSDMPILKPKVLYQRHNQTSDMPILKPKVLYQRHKQTSDMPILKPKVLLSEVCLCLWYKTRFKYRHIWGLVVPLI
jgi:hypothetical protein